MECQPQVPPVIFSFGGAPEYPPYEACVGDLTKPRQRDIGFLEVLMKQGDHAYREIPGDAASRLKEC